MIRKALGEQGEPGGKGGLNKLLNWEIIEVYMLLLDKTCLWARKLTETAQPGQEWAAVGATEAAAGMDKVVAAAVVAKEPEAAEEAAAEDTALASGAAAAEEAEEETEMAEAAATARR